MSVFSFISSAGKKFKITGPDGLTLDQAKAIFNTQDSSGSLVGLKPGGILSAATQAAKGLKSALSSVTQGLSGITGALGGKIASAVGSVGTLAKDLGSKVTSFSTTAVNTLVKAVNNVVPSAGIDVANFAKQDTALGPIAGLNTSQVTGVLAQQTNLVSQAASVMTDTKGVGSYGLSLDQLERAGYVKPGISQVAAAAGSAATTVLSSAKAFTGKDGITSIDTLLSNGPKQAAIQQDLMTKGLADLSASTGLKVDALPSNLQAGLSLSAASSVSVTKDILAGLPTADDVKAKFDNIVSNANFAVNFTDLKVPDAFKEQEVPVPASDTVNRDTLNAATNRILGNPKIPSPNFGPPILKVGTYDASGRQLTSAEILAPATSAASAVQTSPANNF